MEKNTAHTALLVMDVQSAILDNLPEKEDYVLRVNQAINTARQHNITVIFVRVGFRKNVPEVGTNNKFFDGFKKHIMEMGEENFLTLAPSLDRKEEDIVVTKRRVSAFAGSDLEVLLRAQNIKHLVLTGVATSGVVLSTLREASDKDFQLTVLADACADRDPEVHRVLTEKVFARQADIISNEQFAQALSR